MWIPSGRESTVYICLFGLALTCCIKKSHGFECAGRLQDHEPFRASPLLSGGTSKSHCFGNAFAKHAFGPVMLRIPTESKTSTELRMRRILLFTILAVSGNHAVAEKSQRLGRSKKYVEVATKKEEPIARRAPSLTSLSRDVLTLLNASVVISIAVRFACLKLLVETIVDGIVCIDARAPRHAAIQLGMLYVHTCCVLNVLREYTTRQ